MMIFFPLLLFQLFSQSGSYTENTVFSSAGFQISEPQKIELLIQAVEKLDGAKFYRNGTYYSSKKAASHLRLKLSKSGNSVKTARDFIDNIASGSSVSGKPYYIIYSNGNKVTSKEFFYKILEKFENGK